MVGARRALTSLFSLAPCPYILSSSSCLIGYLPRWLPYTLGTIVIHCHRRLYRPSLLCSAADATPASGFKICAHVMFGKRSISQLCRSEWRAVQWCVMISMARFYLACTRALCFEHQPHTLNECLAVSQNLSRCCQDIHSQQLSVCQRDWSFCMRGVHWSLCKCCI